MLRVFASAAVVGTIALAAPALASANSTRVPDPRDVRGAFDIASVTHGHAGSSVVHTLRTYKPFASNLLQHGSFIAFAFDASGDGKVDHAALIMWYAGALRGALVDTSGESLASVGVTRPDKQTVKVTIPVRLLGNPAAYTWFAGTEYKNKKSCKRGCDDYAPNRGVIQHRLQPPMQLLTVRVFGSGRVSSIPAGIDCPARCIAKYRHGEKVTLTATPLENQVFTGWGGACSGSGPCTVTMGSGATVTASFAPTFALTVSLNGPGTVLIAPPNTNCAGQQCVNRFAAGTTVTLTAQPAAGARFDGWNGACSGVAPICTVTVGGDTSVTAQFSPLPGAGPGVRPDGPIGSLRPDLGTSRLERW